MRGLQAQGPHVQDVGGRRCVDLRVKVVVCRVGGFQHPLRRRLSIGGQGDGLLLRRHLFGIFTVAVFMYHPGAGAVIPFHPGGDHVLVLRAVHQDQMHPAGPAPSFVDGGDLKAISPHGQHALAGRAQSEF